MNTPTTPRRTIPERRPRPRFGPDDRDCLYEGIHAKTGKRYSVRMRTVVGEISPSRLKHVLDALVIESSDPTLP